MLPSVEQLFLFTLKSLERNMLQWMGTIARYCCNLLLLNEAEHHCQEPATLRSQCHAFKEGTRDDHLRADGFLPSFKNLETQLMARYSFVAQEPESLCRCLCENLSKSGLSLISREISGVITFI